MEREIGMNKVHCDEEIVSRILGLPMERIEYLKTEHGMPVEDPAFSEWFVANSDLVLDEMKQNFERSLFPRELRPETPEPTP
jgi:hypothetical protein